ncbi:putative G-protein coupled receptor [Apostichopus japonicus]|uniref:Putative G-protein coupled receptor n=1 Tax=Stichopus japonicus TaxID=307972 RepID=A0A2G8JXY1_STIJA|nr:putative G-protein coupled receptor [Apostichopus japonicus]
MMETTTYGNLSQMTTSTFDLTTAVDPRYYRYLPVPLPEVMRYLFISLCVFGFIFGSFGNILVFLAIVKFRKLRTTANAFLASLAVADFGQCIFVLPILATGLISLETIITNDILCRLFYHTTFTFSPVSIQHLILIAANRYTLINKTARTYVKLFNKRTITVLITSIWCGNTLLNLLVAFSSYGTVRFFGTDFCYVDQQNTIGVLFWVLTLLYTFLSCFIIIPVFYVLTFRTVHKSQVRVRQEQSAIDAPSLVAIISNHPSVSRNKQTTGGQRQQRKLLSASEVKLTKVNFFIFVTNVLFLSPLFFLLVINGGEVTHGKFVLIMLPIGMNSVTNPLVYCGFNRNFRGAFKALLRLQRS